MREPRCSDDLLARFATYLKTLKRSPQTVTTYNRQINYFIRWLNDRGITDVTSVSWQDVEGHQSWMVDKYKPNTISIRLRAVRAFYDWMVATGVMTSNPARTASPFRLGYQLPKTVLTEEEVRGLLEAPDIDTHEGIRDRTILEVFYSSGPRVSELCGLDVDDADLDEALLTINRGDLTMMVRKGKGGDDRVSLLTEDAMYWLTKYVDEARPELVTAKSGEAVFLSKKGGGRLGKMGIKHVIDRVARGVGVKKVVTPHTFRHSIATHMLNNGAGLPHLQRFLGHRRLSSTVIYTHLAVDDLKEVHARCHPRSRAA